jgi:MoxR-like ATPase
MESNEIIKAVEKMLGTGTTIRVNLADPDLKDLGPELVKSRNRVALARAGIVLQMEASGTSAVLNRIGKTSTLAPASAPIPQAAQPAAPVAPQAAPKPVLKRHQHTFVIPKIASRVIDCLTDEASHVLWFKGPTGTGKTVFAHYLADELGFELFQLNCHAGMGPESFFGEKTIEVDAATGQNKIVYKDGLVVKAMQAGLDADGNEVGKPGLLFIDEAGAMPTNIAIALNRLLESDNPRRTVVLDRDGGRVVRSHSRFRIILAANTAGRGATDQFEAGYTAQMDALDISLLNRVGMTFRFGYDRKVEQRILVEKIGDDRIVDQAIQYRDAIRKNISEGRLSTPFSTRSLVKIADAYRVFKDFGTALYTTVFEQLMPSERAVYNELFMVKFGKDLLKANTDADCDYL